MRITDIAREQGLNHPEIRRHLTRLRDIGLIERDVEGLYHLTPYGETSILLFKEFEFLSANSGYFETHSLSEVPARFVKQIGELDGSACLRNAMDFFRYTENLFKESKEQAWILVDQFPMNFLSTIVEAINRGVRLRVIEPRERVLNPDLDAMTSEEIQALSQTRRTPYVEQRMLEKVRVLLFLSESRCVLAFPMLEGQHDFKGFTATHESALSWCRELFQHHWDEAEKRRAASLPQVEYERPTMEGEPSESITVVGQDRREADAQAVQEAVDNFDEVILKGTFNFGSSMVEISRSVVVRGEKETYLGRRSTRRAGVFRSRSLTPFSR
jgi:predicted transcriptional regulator